MRLFAALPLSPECVKRLTNFRLRWSAPGDGLRWSSPEQWHITLQFFGDLCGDEARCLEEQVHRLSGPAPTLVVEGVDLFAAKGILFASVKPSQELLRLHERLTECGHTCGLHSESRAFRPHITLARSKGKEGHSALQRLARPTLPSLGTQLQWNAAECLLLQSILHPRGAEYIVLSRVPLCMKTEGSS